MKRNSVETALFVFVAFHVLLGLLLAIINLRYFEGNYVVEDGVIEWLSVDALLLSAGLTISRMYRFKLSKGWPFFIGLFVFAALFIFGAGEEISWGQRIFNIESSDFFKANNGQGETNIHNLVVSGKGPTFLFFLFFIESFQGLKYLWIDGHCQFHKHVTLLLILSYLGSARSCPHQKKERSLNSVEHLYSLF